jgi:hypothetical protein
MGMYIYAYISVMDVETNHTRKRINSFNSDHISLKLSLLVYPKTPWPSPRTSLLQLS